jgi:hypothetical protein
LLGAAPGGAAKGKCSTAIHLFVPLFCSAIRSTQQNPDGTLSTRFNLLLGASLLTTAAFAGNVEGVQLLLKAGQF